MNDDECVLVTGGTGFIAGHSIVQALNAGWRIRTTVRDLAREPALRAVIGSHAPLERLEVVAADLTADAGWLVAATGCTYVLHIASPFQSVSPKNDAELVQPARDGTLRVLAAAREAGVRRVVMTSSTAAVAYGRGGREKPFTEADWSDETNLSDTSGYGRSKTIAERAAWTWMEQQGQALELVTICPGAVLGPVLGPDRSASIGIIARLLDGSLPGLARFAWPLVDVRDVAALHLLAMTDPYAAGQRLPRCGRFRLDERHRQCAPRARAAAGHPGPPAQLAQPTGARLRSGRPRRPQPIVRARQTPSGHSRKARRELGWTPRANQDAIVATAQSLA